MISVVVCMTVSFLSSLVDFKQILGPHRSGGAPGQIFFWGKKVRLQVPAWICFKKPRKNGLLKGFKAYFSVMINKSLQTFKAYHS